jgi:RNA polymerase sigma-70 factor (ECF subfamily)
VDEAALVAAACAGEGEAFARLVERHQARVRALARGLVGDAALAEDVAQETFVRAWRGLAGFRADASFVAWLCTITRRTALEQAHRRRRRAEVPLEHAAAAADPRGRDPVLRLDLERGLAQLDHGQREAFLLVAVLGLGYQEAAVVLECPLGTVASRVARARARLAAWISQGRGAPAPRGEEVTR